LACETLGFRENFLLVEFKTSQQNDVDCRTKRVLHSEISLNSDDDK